MTAASVAVIAGVTGCGNQITANYSWKAQGQYVLTPDQSDNGYTTTTSGPLLDRLERPLLGTYFQERCIEPPTSGQAPPQRCIAVVNTGRQVYVASGITVDGPFGTLASLDSSPSRDTIVIARIVGNDPNQPPPYLLRISAHHG
jgi:hypothetical protein